MESVVEERIVRRPICELHPLQGCSDAIQCLCRDYLQVDDVFVGVII